MAIAVEMPKMSDTMEEGVLVAWLANEGDAVSAGDVIAQVETDKATMDLEVYDDGVLLKKVIEAGASVPIGGLIAVLGKEGENPDDVLAQYGSGDGAAPTSGEAEAAEPEPAVADPEPSGDGASAPVPVTVADDGRVKASPLARRMAQDGGLDLRGVQGSGPEGRVVKRDVEAALAGSAPVAAPVSAPAPKPQPVAVPTPATPRPAPAPALPVGESADTPMSQMRKTIARRLAASKFTAPHFYLTMEVDMQATTALRKEMNAMQEAQGLGKISFNDFITKACAVALRRHPAVNSSWLEDEGVIRHHGAVHVAVAVAIDEGLVTPVVRNADQKGLAQIAAETKDLATRARDRQLDPSEWEGSTFTTSNLGMFGIEEFTAIINPPNACILAIGGIMDVPVVENGEVVPGKRMKVTLSCDHRVVDGATGAAFLGDVKRFLEDPMLMLL
ncbi:MAG: pyruvate dehydrogenase complex dihydrolipoamide acetyltransferase [Rhodothermaceae bacterium]|nr:pyruvate dehydrogenase complex dihydrolipoamide acetyltransferase [Rhodothermaceae bacterium]